MCSIVTFKTDTCFETHTGPLNKDVVFQWRNRNSIANQNTTNTNTNLFAAVQNLFHHSTCTQTFHNLTSDTKNNDICLLTNMFYIILMICIYEAS